MKIWKSPRNILTGKIRMYIVYSPPIPPSRRTVSMDENNEGWIFPVLPIIVPRSHMWSNKPSKYIWFQMYVHK